MASSVITPLHTCIQITSHTFEMSCMVVTRDEPQFADSISNTLLYPAIYHCYTKSRTQRHLLGRIITKEWTTGDLNC